MNISLTPVLENYVKNKVDSGLYNSASEVVREGLRALQEKEIDAKIKRGLEQVEAGKTIPFDEDYAEKLIERIEQRAKDKNS